MMATTKDKRATRNPAAADANCSAVEHEHSCCSNNNGCFTTFIGCRVVGVLKNALPLGRADLACGNRTLVFECGWGLTIANNGSCWIESPSEIESAANKVADHLKETIAALKGVLQLAE